MWLKRPGAADMCIPMGSSEALLWTAEGMQLTLFIACRDKELAAITKAAVNNAFNTILFLGVTLHSFA